MTTIYSTFSIQDLELCYSKYDEYISYTNEMISMLKEMKDEAEPISCDDKIRDHSLKILERLISTNNLLAELIGERNKIGSEISKRKFEEDLNMLNNITIIIMTDKAAKIIQYNKQDAMQYLIIIISDLSKNIKDIDSKLENENDPNEIQNLEMSKYYLIKNKDEKNRKLRYLIVDSMNKNSEYKKKQCKMLDQASNMIKDIDNAIELSGKMKYYESGVKQDKIIQEIRYLRKEKRDILNKVKSIL